MNHDLKSHSVKKSTGSSLLDNKTFLTAVFLVLAAVAIVLVFYLISLRNPHRSLNEVIPNYDALYKDAQKAIKDKNLDQAQQDLQKIVLSNPKYKDAKKKLASVSKENLYQKVLKSLKEGNIKDAQRYLDQLALYDPNYKDSQAIREDLKDGKYDGNITNDIPGGNTGASNTNSGSNENNGSDSGGSNNNGGSGGDNGGGNTGGDGNTINEPTESPLAILPVDLSGYNMLQKIWTVEPIESQAVYRSKTKLDRLNVDMVVISVHKYDQKSKAQNALFNKEEDFNSNTAVVTLNGHETYYGRYPKDEFPRAAIMAWTINRWFFSVMVIPGQKLISNPAGTNDILRDTATDVTKKFGY